MEITLSLLLLMGFGEWFFIFSLKKHFDVTVKTTFERFVNVFVLK